ncbi:hypothetical protein AVEN_84560-1 [Araneus ventricosus]|nr:hypothetical protein AVEN_84560-1 [Araneus ventricosus]
MVAENYEFIISSPRINNLISRVSRASRLAVFRTMESLLEEFFHYSVSRKELDFLLSAEDDLSWRNNFISWNNGEATKQTEASDRHCIHFDLTSSYSSHSHIYSKYQKIKCDAKGIEVLSVTE